MEKTLQKWVKIYADGPFTENEFKAAISPATLKLTSIIEREGDENGMRNQPFYLAILVCEQMRARRLEQECSVHCELINMEKERVAKADALS